MLIRRPANGFSSVAEFWAMLARTGLSPLSEVGQQVKLTTHWFGAEITVDVGGTQVIEKALIDARSVPVVVVRRHWGDVARSEEDTSELQSLMRISYAVFCLNKKKQTCKNPELDHRTIASICVKKKYHH